MGILRAEFWGLGVGYLLLLVSVVINVTSSTLRIPNALSLGGLATGLVASVLVMLPLGLPSPSGSLAASLLGVLTAFVLMLPFYLRRSIDAGVVKMQMALGAWVGCSLTAGKALLLIAGSTLLALVIYYGAVLVSRRLSQDQLEALHEKAPSKRIPSQPLMFIAAVIVLFTFAGLGWI